MQPNHYLEALAAAAELYSVRWDAATRQRLFAEFLAEQKVPMFVWDAFLARRARESLPG
jgi:hypothetical protein